MGRRRVRTELAVTFVAAALVYVMTVAFLVTDAAQEARQSGQRDLRFSAHLAGAELENETASVLSIIADAADDPSWEDTVRGVEPCQLTVTRLGIFPVRLDVIDAAGRVTCSTGEAKAAPAGAAKVLGAEGPTILPAYIDATTKRPSLGTGIPIFATADPGRVIGAAVIVLDLGDTARSLESVLAGPEKLEFWVVLDGRTISRSPGSPADRRGGWLHATAPVPGNGLSVVAHLDEAVVRAEAADAARSLGTAGAFGFLCLGAALWVLNRRIARPLVGLRRAVEANDPALLADGIAGPAEVAQLHVSLHDMMRTRDRQAEELRRQAFIDRLTGLPNRAALMLGLDGDLAAADDVASVVVVALDVRRFSLVNDSYGQAFGDAVLVDLAERLRALVPEPYGLFAFGGDEFALSTSKGSASEALALARTLRAALLAPHDVADRRIELLIRAGIAAGHEGETADALMRHARTALGRAKLGQAGGAAVFDLDLDLVSEERAELERDLRGALERDELFVVYQPTVDMQSGTILGVEALVRWQHGTRGVVSPVEFIPVAEDARQISAIGAWVLRTACEDAVRLRSAHGPLRLSVNVSARQLGDAGFGAMVRQVLDDTGLDPRSLCLEMTESVMIEGIDLASGELSQLRTLGVEVALDDFGTGYSSLSYLNRLEADEVKIDRSFVSALGQTPGASTLVRTVVLLARELSMAVIAEGIETREQVEALLALGCERGQGFFFGRPMPAEAISDLLDQRAVQ